MKQVIIVLLVFLGFSLEGFSQGENFYIPLPDGQEKPIDPQYGIVENECFNPGEQIFFKVTFGWFTIGKAEMKVDTRSYEMNGRDCYKIDVHGKTSGMVDWIAQVDDRWGTYLDKNAFVPHKAYRYIKEGNYRKNEITKFDHLTDMIEVTVLDRKTGAYGNPKYYEAANNIHDMIGGFFYFRTVDFTKMKKGDSFLMTGFYEDTFYDMKIIYAGKEKINTKMGTINTIKIIPVMPENSLFDGEDSIVAWLSDDANKIPVKVSAEMFIGSAGFEVTEVRNLRNKLNIEK
ncbi:MAG: DUF3108 domain-containing protein [Cyclobacteriaceae bacterium]|nr:DUF3108 domain-containing protein [Cyclobacteriaceae bacterium]